MLVSRKPQKTIIRLPLVFWTCAVSSIATIEQNEKRKTVNKIDNNEPRDVSYIHHHHISLIKWIVCCNATDIYTHNLHE